MGFLALLSAQFAAGLLAAITDFREGKIYNKHLAFFGLIGICIIMVFRAELMDPYGDGLITNAVCSLVVSFLLFYTRFWSAGDAKLFCLLAVLTPFAAYPSGLLFPGFYPLMAICCLAFAYIVGESVCYWARDRRRPGAQQKLALLMKPNQATPVDWVLRYLAASLLLGAVFRLVGDMFPAMVSLDRGLFIVVGMLFLVILNNRLRTRRALCLAAVTGLAVNVLHTLVTGAQLSDLLDPRAPFIALITTAVMRFAMRYDYKQIPTTELKVGMILSALTIAGFRLSQARGLPMATTEGSDSRLSHEEVEKIKAWGASQIPETNVVIVAHIPFAPFIFIGNIAYTIAGYHQTLLR